MDSIVVQCTIIPGNVNTPLSAYDPTGHASQESSPDPPPLPTKRRYLKSVCELDGGRKVIHM